MEQARDAAMWSLEKDDLLLSLMQSHMAGGTWEQIADAMNARDAAARMRPMNYTAEATRQHWETFIRPYLWPGNDLIPLSSALSTINLSRPLAPSNLRPSSGVINGEASRPNAYDGDDVGPIKLPPILDIFEDGPSWTDGVHMKAHATGPPKNFEEAVERKGKDRFKLSF